LYVDQKTVDNYYPIQAVKHSLSIKLMPNESNES